MHLAARHVQITTWTAPTADTTLTVAGKTVPLRAGATVQDAVNAINASGAAVTASPVNDGTGQRLQLAATKDGLAGVFSVSGGQDFKLLSQGADAKITVGPGSAAEFSVVSPTNSFSSVLAGSSFTVSKAGETATVAVAGDPAAVTTAVQALVTAANNALSTISEYGDNKPGSKAVLRGDSTLRELAGQVLGAVSAAVGRSTASDAGLELTRDGRIAFDSAAFTAALKTDPGLARRLVDGDGTSPGVARRLLAVAERATNGTTGSLVGLAGGMDRQVTELQSRIDAWDLRLELRQQALTKQFTALESALGGLQNKSMWLSSQLANLPTWSRS